MLIVSSADPIELFEREHQAGLEQVARLENAAHSIMANGFSVDAFEEITAAVRWLNIDVRRHTDTIELWLLPLVEHHDREIPRVIRREHRDLWSAYGQLVRDVHDVEEGHLHGSTIREMVRASMGIAGLLRDHIEREINVFFPSIRQALTAAEFHQLTESLTGARSSARALTEEDFESYWTAVQEKVCSKCIDSDRFGSCRLTSGEECGLKLHFPRIVETVLAVKSTRSEPYLEALRQNVCAHCKNQSPDGTCSYRMNLDCGLDRYFPLVIEALEEADARRNEHELNRGA